MLQWQVLGVCSDGSNLAPAPQPLSALHLPGPGLFREWAVGSGLETRDINNFTYLIRKIYLSSDRHMFLEKFNIDDDTHYIYILTMHSAQEAESPVESAATLGS